MCIHVISIKFLNFINIESQNHRKFAKSILILGEKSFADFFGPLQSKQKKSLKILKNYHTGELHKTRYNFAPDAAN